MFCVYFFRVFLFLSGKSQGWNSQGLNVCGHHASASRLGGLKLNGDLWTAQSYIVVHVYLFTCHS